MCLSDMREPREAGEPQPYDANAPLSVANFHLFHAPTCNVKLLLQSLDNSVVWLSIYIARASETFLQRLSDDNLLSCQQLSAIHSLRHLTDSDIHDCLKPQGLPRKLSLLKTLLSS